MTNWKLVIGIWKFRKAIMPDLPIDQNTNQTFKSGGANPSSPPLPPVEPAKSTFSAGQTSTSPAVSSESPYSLKNSAEQMTEETAAPDLPPAISLEKQSPVTSAGVSPTLNQPGPSSLGDKPLPPPPIPTVPKPAEKKQEVYRSAGFPFKKILSVIIVIAILLGMGFAFIRFVLPKLKFGGLGKVQSADLVYWGLWEPDGVIKEVINDWEKDHPNIKVSYSQKAVKEYRERLQSDFAKGEGPDIFRFHNTWVPMFKNELDSVPASVMDAATFKQTFYPVADSSLRSGTGYVGLPLEIDTLALFYNTDIFAAAGVTPPKTWDELRRLASQLTLRDTNGRIQRAGVALGTTNNIWHWSDILALMMLQNGADLSKPTDQLAKDALTFYLLFSKTDRVWDETMPDSMVAFATGKTAMYFGFSWDVFEIQANNPRLNFKIISAPQLPGTDIAWASFWAEGVAKKSKNKEAAWEFLKYLSSEPVMQKLYQTQSQLRSFGEPYSRVKMADLVTSDPLVAPFIQQAPKAKSWYLCSRTWDNGINDTMIRYFEEAVNSGDTEALATAAQGINQNLSQYGLTGRTP